MGAIVLLAEGKYKGKTPYFAGINKVRFKKKVFPGDTIRMDIEITRVRGSIGIGKGIAFVDDEIAREGESIFAIE